KAPARKTGSILGSWLEFPSTKTAAKADYKTKTRAATPPTKTRPPAITTRPKREPTHTFRRAGLATAAALSATATAIIHGSALALGLCNAIFAPSKETLRGSGITLIPAAAVALGIWFFAIRTPPAPTTIAQQKPATELNQLSEKQASIGWVEEPAVTEPAPPA